MKAVIKSRSILIILIILVFSVSGLLLAFHKEEATTPIESIRNSSGLQLMVADQNTQPTLRIVLPSHATSDRSIEILFPEHLTIKPQGNTDARQIYMFRPGKVGDPPQWERSEKSLAYEKTIPGKMYMRATAILVDDGVRFQFKLRNLSKENYDLALAILDPRLTSEFHDERLERTFVHHADGFDLLASETPNRLTMPMNEWLPARYLVSFTWPIPSKLVDHRDDGITYYNKSRKVDAPFIATFSKDKSWVIASFTYNTGNVWSNPDLTCQHVDPQASLSPGEEVILETKMLIVRSSLDEVFRKAMQQRDSLIHK